mgnify:CR=1 FL=1
MKEDETANLTKNNELKSEEIKALETKVKRLESIIDEKEKAHSLIIDDLWKTIENLKS